MCGGQRNQTLRKKSKHKSETRLISLIDIQVHPPPLYLATNVRIFLHIHSLSLDHVHARKAEVGCESEHEEEEQSREDVGRHIHVVHPLCGSGGGGRILLLETTAGVGRLLLREAFPHGELSGVLDLRGGSDGGEDHASNDGRIDGGDDGGIDLGGVFVDSHADDQNVGLGNGPPPPLLRLRNLHLGIVSPLDLGLRHRGQFASEFLHGHLGDDAVAAPPTSLAGKSRHGARRFHSPDVVVDLVRGQVPSLHAGDLPRRRQRGQSLGTVCVPSDEEDHRGQCRGRRISIPLAVAVDDGRQQRPRFDGIGNVGWAGGAAALPNDGRGGGGEADGGGERRCYY